MFRRITLFAAVLLLVAWEPKGPEAQAALKSLLANETLAVANWTDDIQFTAAYPTCKLVKNIAAANLVTYDSAPNGKHLHKGFPW